MTGKDTMNELEARLAALLAGALALWILSFAALAAIPLLVAGGGPNRDGVEG